MEYGKAPWILKKRGRTQIKRNITTADGFHIASVGGCFGLKDDIDAIAILLTAAPDLLNALEFIMNIDESQGVKGRTYGDTQYDSLSGHYGSNEMLNYIKSLIEPAIKKARGL